MNYTWVTWKGAKRNHAARVNPADVRVGSFPLACGRWAPDGWDADVYRVQSSYDGPRCCARCSAAVARRTS